METDVNPYKKIERSRNDVELVGEKLDLRSQKRNIYVTAESMLQQNLKLNL